MNQDQKQKPQQQDQKQSNGAESQGGAGVPFVPSQEPSKLEPTPETAQQEKNARH